MLSFLIGAIASMFTALAYSEFAARVPVTGSAYTFAYASFGEFLAWMYVALPFFIVGASCHAKVLWVKTSFCLSKI